MRVQAVPTKNLAPEQQQAVLSTLQSLPSEAKIKSITGVDEEGNVRTAEEAIKALRKEGAQRISDQIVAAGGEALTADQIKAIVEATPREEKLQKEISDAFKRAEEAQEQIIDNLKKGGELLKDGLVEGSQILITGLKQAQDEFTKNILRGSLEKDRFGLETDLKTEEETKRDAEVRLGSLTALTDAGVTNVSDARSLQSNIQGIISSIEKGIENSKKIRETEAPSFDALEFGTNFVNSSSFTQQGALDSALAKEDFQSTFSSLSASTGGKISTETLAAKFNDVFSEVFNSVLNLGDGSTVESSSDAAFQAAMRAVQQEALGAVSKQISESRKQARVLGVSDKPEDLKALQANIRGLDLSDISNLDDAKATASAEANVADVKATALRDSIGSLESRIQAIDKPVEAPKIQPPKFIPIPVPLEEQKKGGGQFLNVKDDIVKQIAIQKEESPVQQDVFRTAIGTQENVKSGLFQQLGQIFDPSVVVDALKNAGTIDDARRLGAENISNKLVESGGEPLTQKMIDAIVGIKKETSTSTDANIFQQAVSVFDVGANNVRDAIVSFGEGASAIVESMNNFIANISPLTEAMNNFPREITLTSNQQVEVVLNGASILQQLTPQLRNMVVDEVTQALQQQLGQSRAGQSIL